MSEAQAEQLMQQMQMLETYFSDLSQREGTFLNILERGYCFYRIHKISWSET